MELYLKSLAEYGISTGLIRQEDRVVVINRLLDVLGVDAWEEPSSPVITDLETILKGLTDDAVARGLVEDDITARDLFDTRLMGTMVPMPSQVRDTFWEKYRQDPRKATEYYYKLSQDSDYIRRYRIQKDLRWKYDSPYGRLDVTINLSKPEKDAKSVLAASKAPQTGYPKCALCAENEGYAGRINHPARQNHRIIPVTLDGSAWYWQYSPYVYYLEHCIVFSAEHTPMKIHGEVFRKLLDFVRQFPHYFVGSNADLPIVGGSILSHEHFQGGGYELPLTRAEVETRLEFEEFPQVSAGIVRWPLSVIRLQGTQAEPVAQLAEKILKAWRGYTDESAFIFAETEGEPHSTITPIARMRDGKYELDLILRNNITTPEHPHGVYHPHAHLHHIKKESIGLIEAMGLAVLPPRLKGEMARVQELVLTGGDLRKEEATAKHADWAEEFLRRRSVTRDNIEQVLQEEIGAAFCQGLECAGVYKRTEQGKAAFLRFVQAAGGKGV